MVTASLGIHTFEVSPARELQGLTDCLRGDLGAPWFSRNPALGLLVALSGPIVLGLLIVKGIDVAQERQHRFENMPTYRRGRSR